MYVRTLSFFFLAIFLCLPAYAYKTETIKTFKDHEKNTLVLERAYAPGLVRAGMQRMQIRTEGGRIIAYTPTRITAIPFCLSADYCWVFMWKTVYPLPAIFKFNPDRDTWSSDLHPPMNYSRSGNDGVGFTKRTNPLWGVWGIVLFFAHKMGFFSILMVLSTILFLQINKFRDLPPIQKVWIRRILFIITAPIPIPFLPMEPFILTSLIILVGSFVSVGYIGVPMVLSILISIATFFICSVLLVKSKRRRKALS